MKTSRETLIKKLLCVNTNTHLVIREKKVYFLLLHEDFYSFLIANNDGLLVSKFFEKEKDKSFFLKNNYKKYRKGSFLVTKYIITFLRSNNFFCRKQSFFSNQKFQGKKVYKNFLSFSSDLIYKKVDKNIIKKEMGFYFILDSITFFFLLSEGKNFCCKHLTKNDFSRSLHKSLEFIEKHWNFSSLNFEGSLFHIIHPEILIRIFRKNFHDSSFLHLVRSFLHFHLSETLTKNFLSKNIRTVFWNIYVLEIDQFFVSNCSYSSLSNENYYNTSISLSSTEKFNEWMVFEQRYYPESFFQDDLNNRRNEQKQIFLDYFKTCKYIRTNMNWLFLFQEDNFWSGFSKRNVMHFFVCRLGYIFPVRKFFSFLKFEEMSDNFTSFFLGYSFHFSFRKNLVKINTKFFPLMNPFVLRFLIFMNPFSLLSFLLAKQNFCTSLGFSKAKSGWLTLSDTEIIYSFFRIRNSLSLFYSGCHNVKSLSRIQYIVNLSCAKTLAYKHKTSLREISKKFAKGLIIKDSLKRSVHAFNFSSSRNSRLKNFYEIQKITRFWNFQLIQIDSIFLHVDDLYNFCEY